MHLLNLVFYIYRRRVRRTKILLYYAFMRVHHTKTWHLKLSTVNGSSAISEASAVNSIITFSSCGFTSSGIDIDDRPFISSLMLATLSSAYVQFTFMDVKINIPENQFIYATVYFLKQANSRFYFQFFC